MKKSIAFFSCSNGLGHFSRVLKISKYLANDFEITIYCEKFQYDKFKPNLKAKFIFYTVPNIRWDETLSKNEIDFENYIKWCSTYGPESLKYDKVISDNVVGLLEYREDIILSGSFLWADVFEHKFGKNTLSDFDNNLLDKFNPLSFTNKYVEIGKLKNYKNKVQFGWGCDYKPYKEWGEGKYFVLCPPSLDYLPKYERVISKFGQGIPFTGNIQRRDFKYDISWNINTTENCTFLIRPGVGMLTHCVENYIPVVALYSDKDSIEIIELAEQVEILNIGKKINIDDKNLKFKDIFTTNNNTIYNKVTFEKDGYKNIANYLKNL